VTTTAARYQNIAINQTKLSGQCGRLKCCLNYELDTYMDALKDFPKGVDYVKTKRGKAALIKTDIFKGIMYYGYTDEKVRSPMVALDIERVKKIQEMNKAGELPDELIDKASLAEIGVEEEKEIEYADVTGQIELPNIKRKKRRKKRKKRPSSSSSKKEASENKGGRPKERGAADKQNQAKSGDSPKKQPSNKRRKNRRRPNRKSGRQGPSDSNKNSKE